MDVAAVIGLVLGLGVGLGVGFVLGRRLRPCRRGMFWLASGGSVLLGILVVFFGQIVGATLLSGGGIGIMTGGLNGIRWGFGRLTDGRNQVPVAPGQCDAPVYQQPPAHAPQPPARQAPSASPPQPPAQQAPPAYPPEAPASPSAPQPPAAPPAAPQPAPQAPAQPPQQPHAAG
jgi:hypothetical protein